MKSIKSNTTLPKNMVSPFPGDRVRKPILLGFLCASFILCFTLLGYGTTKDVKHYAVFQENGKFAAWPANHGIWSWGDEILVGFQIADHRDGRGHTWDSTTSLHYFARSLDGGENWTLENALDKGFTARATGHNPGDMQREPRRLNKPIDFSHPDLAFTFRRTTNSRGPSHFYYSYNRGHDWNGPFLFPSLGTRGIATRTDYTVLDEKTLVAFLTTAKDDGQIGWSAMAKTEDGGLNWEKLSWIDPDPVGQTIMPAGLKLSSGDWLAVVRKTGDRSQPGARKWLAAYLSQDEGESWEWISDPADELGWNSNAPALLELSDSRLALIYAVRGRPSHIEARYSSDNGLSWSEAQVVRGNDGANRDVGYVRAVERYDGKIVAVYYYNHAYTELPYRYIAATIFSPTSED